MSTSTRSIRDAGMKLRSAQMTPGSPGIRRLPSISTRVRPHPRPRKSTVAVPDAPLEMFDPWPAKACGNWLITSSTRTTPASWIWSEPSTLTGLTLVRFGSGMREPVTTNSVTAVPLSATWVVAVCAKAPPAEMAATATPVIMEVARRRARVVAMVKVWSSVRAWRRAKDQAPKPQP